MKQLIKHFWKENLLMLVILLGNALALTATSLMQIFILDALISLNLINFLQTMGYLLMAYLIMLGMTYLKIRYQSKLIQQQTTFLRVKVLKKISQISYEDFKSKESQSYVSWFTNDMDLIEKQSLVPLYALIGGIINAITSGIALLTMHWSLIALTASLVLVLLFIPKLFSGRMERTTRQVAQANEEFIQKIGNYLMAYDTIFSYRKFSYIIKKTEQASDHLAQEKNNYQKEIGWVTVISGLGNILSQFSLYALTGYLAVQQIVTIGSLSATASLAGDIFNTVSNISQYLAIIKSSKPIFDKFEALEPAHYISQNLTPIDELSLENISFAYQENPLFTGLSYRFKMGGKYAIIGNSGSGKSTLLNLLAGKNRHYQGTIRYGENSILDVDYDSLYENMIYINQHDSQIEGTILENLTFGEELSVDYIYKILEALDLKQVISQLPDGLNTKIGDKGSLLSGGQLQRLSIARALLHDKPILLLDESTSGLDQETMLKIENLLIQQKHKTLIMVTHHLHPEILQQLDGVLQLT